MLEPSKRNQALDGLRGLAATAVIFYHAILFQIDALETHELVMPVQHLSGAASIIARAVLSIVNGHIAVVLFFVLSGFVLGKSLERMDGHPLHLCIQFAVRRLFRLYPAIFAGLAFFDAVALGCRVFGLTPLRGMPQPDIWPVVQNALLFKITWHGPTWTLQGEVLAIPFLLIFHFARRWLGAPGLILCFCFCLLSYQIPGMLLNLPNMSAVLTPMCLGMLIASDSGKLMFQRADPATPWIVSAALFCSTFFFGFESQFTELARVLLCAVLVGAAYYGSQNSFNKLMSGSIPVYLGKISYSLYLVNVPIFISIGALFPRDNLASGIAVGATATLVSIPVADLLERFVEIPGVKLGSALLHSRAPKQVISAS